MEEFRCAGNQSLHARKQPAIRWRESGKFRRNSILLQESLAETGHIPQLRDQFGPDSYLLLADNRVLAEASAGRPVTHRVCRVFLDHLHRGHRPAAATLTDLTGTFCGQAPAGNGHLFPGQNTKLVIGFHDCIEGPGANDLMPLWTQ